MNNTTQSMFQSVLTIAGGYFVSKGIASHDQVQAIVAGIFSLAAVLWGYFHHSKTPPPSATGAASLLIGAMLLGGVLTGCQTTPQTATYQATGATVTTVDAAMNLWGAYVAENHPSTNEEIAVRDAFGKYQAAMATVCDAGAVYAATAQTTNSVYGTPASASAALQQAIANADQEISDLENLIQSFGVKLNQ